MESKPLVLWALRIIPAIILLQTLFFKFTGAPEAVAIFTSLGVEPWGRILTGALELVVGALLLIPRMSVWGALGGIGLMLGAIASHLLVLGVDTGDGGLLFGMAVVVLACCVALTLVERQHLPFVR